MDRNGHRTATVVRSAQRHPARASVGRHAAADAPRPAPPLRLQLQRRHHLPRLPHAAATNTPPVTSARPLQVRVEIIGSTITRTD
jgi:hypothetical protein